MLAAAADEEGLRRTLRTLKMGGNLLGDNKVVRGALCTLVRAAPSRVHSRDSAPAGGTPSKGAVASRPPALRTLHLAGNHLGARTAAPLAAALAESALTELDLSWNLLLAAGVEALALALQTKASSLQTLKLGWNGAGPKGGLALGAMLSANSTLTSLDVQHNNLDGVAAAVIAQAVQHDNRSLRTLELSHNPLGRKGTSLLMASLADNVELTSVGLQHTMAGLDGVRDKMANGEATGAGASLDFDAENPEGEYALDLGKPWERWVACKLQQLSVQQSEPWEDCSYDDGRTPHFSRHAAVAWSERQEVPAFGHLRLRYRSSRPVEQSLVHYTLDLADPAQREVPALSSRFCLLVLPPRQAPMYHAPWHPSLHTCPPSVCRWRCSCTSARSSSTAPTGRTSRSTASASTSTRSWAGGRCPSAACSSSTTPRTRCGPSGD